jgi:flagellar motility protein MotE (MotC chaperone)
MKLSLKDILVIAIVTLLSFPILFMTMLFVTGNARLEFGKRIIDKKKQEELQIVRLTEKRDSLYLVQSQIFLAAQKEKAEIEEQRKRLAEESDRVAMARKELDDMRALITGERQKIEGAVAKSDSASQKKIKQLAKVYQAMRPAEAARILETLNENLMVKIMNAMTDDRQKGRIMSALSPAKATSISDRITR